MKTDENVTSRGRTGRAEPKIGVEEFLAIAERFGFDAAADVIDRVLGAHCKEEIMRS